jgi:HPt (histidine-containing phosphotransfer) domain-containing protein
MAENDTDSGVKGGVVYVDQADGLKRVMNNTKLYATLLNKFKAGTKLDELSAAIEAGDMEKAQRAAHTVKGVAANLSLVELYKQVLDLETQIKAGSLNPGVWESVVVCFDKTLASIDGVLAQYEG